MKTLTNTDRITAFEFAADLVKSQLANNQERFDAIFTECVAGDPHIAKLALKTVAVIAARSMYVLHAGNPQVAVDRLDTDVMEMGMRIKDTPKSD